MASQVIAYLEAIVGADVTAFRSGMAEVRAEITETAGVGESLTAVGTALTVGLVIAGGVGLKVFSDFDASMRNVNSIMQLSEDQFKTLGDQVLKFGENTRNGAQGAAQALYTIVSAGFGINDTAQAMQLLDVATRGAEAGLADTDTVAQTLAQSLLAYGKGADSAQHFMDVLTQTVNLGVGSMDDVTGSIGQVINIAALAGVSWDDLGGSMAFLTQRGMSFANAATSINQVVSQLIKPTDGLTAAYAKLGVSGGTELIAKFGGLGGALEALGKVSGTSAEDLAKLFTNVRALRGAASILGNFGDYGKLMTQFGNSLNGVTGRAWLQQAKSFASQLDYIKSNVLGFLISVGSDLKDSLKPAVDAFADFTNGLSQLDDQTVKNIVTIGLIIIGVTALGFAINILLSSSLTPLILGVALLYDAWTSNFLGIQDAVNAAMPNINKFLNDVHLALITFYANVSQDWYNIVSVFDTYLNGDITELLHDVFVGNWQKAQFDVEQIWIDLVRLFHDKLEQPLKDALDGLVSSVKQKIGELLASFSPDQLTGIATAIITIGGALLIAGIPMAIGKITEAVNLLRDAFLVLNSVAIAPLIPIILLIIGLIWTWENNFMGLHDRTDELRGTLEKTVTTLKQLVFLFDYYTQGEAKAKADLANMFGMDTSSNDPFAGAVSDVHSGGLGNGLGQKSNTHGLNNLLGIASPKLQPDYKDIGKASGYSSNSNSQVSVTIVTSDPNVVINGLRRVGVDLRARTQG